MKTRVVSATEFKAHCLALLREVEEHGGTISVTRRGRPIAVVGAPAKKKWKSPANSFFGRAEIVGDIVNYDTSHLWEAFK
ncbi:MAG: type II toxin-antitoxin system Phd/YefM family antitoxin [Bryobacteraceae bacterium]